MAEVINIPTARPAQATLSRETSSLDKGSTPEKKELAKVELKGAVTVTKPTFRQKLKETFVAEDMRDVGDYILWDILVPTIKRTIRDIIVGSTDRVLLGTGTSVNRSSTLYRDHGVTRVRTDYASKTRSRSQTTESRATLSARARTNFGLSEIVFENYDDAASVLERLVDYLDTYGKVSVDDYFDLIDRTSDYTAQSWGWTSLSSATIVQTVGGYVIKLPNPVPIKG